ncbi:MAG TPA: peptidase inhibitor family I36 protein [Amycolatopsis sp.]|uniref:peptidase inhibitor family I36 protein n=1 Tax=Amycolatopsis sp. TaxID=37632 RepID=UPI002B47B86C|nr:peptidase inhibitor family I36 protein [Amycolatopsis sp.]HKS44499.1 peptidase inhibitor family I36 protein [Amycolatopsis sp.]
MISKLRAHLPRLLVFAAFGLLGGAGIAQADPASPPSGRPELACQQGEFCTWTSELYSGTMQRFDLRTVNPEECVVLPDDVEARSFANRLDRDVTVYQDVECTTEGDFITYPGHDTFAPHSPFLVRAIKIWE